MSAIEKCLDACKQIGINQPHFAIVINDARTELAELRKDSERLEKLFVDIEDPFIVVANSEDRDWCVFTVKVIDKVGFLAKMQKTPRAAIDAVKEPKT